MGTGSLLPTGAGGTAFVDYDFMDQTRNWSGAHAAPAANNSDKEIRSDFVTVGTLAAFVEKPFYLQPSSGFARVTLKSHNGFIDLKVSPQ